MSAKLLSTKWGPFADDPGSPLMNLGNEAAWDQVYEIELEEFRRRQRAKLAAPETGHDQKSEQRASPTNAR